MRRVPLVGAAAFLIAAGLVLRLAAHGLPVWIRHVGGGLLWGAMVFMIVAALRPPRWTRRTCIIVASVIAIAVELTRLYHTPEFDTFRMTLAGQLLFGRLFSPWNMMTYEAGILFAAGAPIDWRPDHADVGSR